MIGCLFGKTEPVVPNVVSKNDVKYTHQKGIGTVFCSVRMKKDKSTQINRRMYSDFLIHH